VQEETETQKAIWTPPHTTHIDMERTLLNQGSGIDSLNEAEFG